MSTRDESVFILYVDDESDIVETVQADLEGQDDRFTVETATTASEALGLLADKEFDCLVLGDGIHGRDGVELLDAVGEEVPNLPVVLSPRERSPAAVSSRLTDSLQRTAESEELAACVTTAVSEHRARGELERRVEFHKRTQAIAGVGAWQYEAGTDHNSYLTDHALRIHGLSPEEELTPEESLAYYHEEDRDTVREAFERALEEGEPYDLTARLVTENDSLRWVHTTGEPQVEDGEVVRVRGTLQDVTEHKQREEELERQNERLEEFAQIVSHDIRTPLQVAVTQLELGRRTGADEHFEEVKRAHNQMQNLIDDILTLARQGLRLDETASVSIDAAVREVFQSLDTSGLTLKVLGNTMIKADPDRLDQLFQNLLTNAADHGGEDVTVSVGPIEGLPTTTRGGGDIRFGFFVADDGPGIPESEREDVFDPGYTTAEGGTGFGLAIVEQVALAHGWEITVTESRNGGARFEIVGVDSPSQ